MEMEEMFGNFVACTYKVGGCVRDDMMGLEVNDVDFVCVASESDFKTEFPFAKKVGNDFPVYLIEGHEVALSRTEKSTGDGYHNFKLTGVGVPLEDDLFRRDFTINAIAENCATMEIYDPYDGMEDIENGTLRTVFTAAFDEDPVRILRGARFAARFGFGFDFNTLMLMKDAASKLEYVTKERIALEIEKMYKQTKTPSVFFKVLAEIDALKYIFKELDDLRYVPAGPKEFHGSNSAFDHTMEVINRAKENDYSFKVFMGALCHDLGKGVTKKEILPHHFGHEFKSKQLAVKWLSENCFKSSINKFVPTAAEKHMLAHVVTKMRLNKRIKHFNAIRRDSWDDFVAVCNCDHPISDETRTAIDNVFEAIKTTKIEIPKGHKDPKQFANDAITKRLKELER